MKAHYLWLFDGAQLIEHAQFQQLFKQLMQTHRLVDLYSNEAEALHLHGPLLCDLNADEVDLVQLLFAHEFGFYASRLLVNTDTATLVSQWQKTVNLIECETGERYYLRYADTRVFEALPHIMNRTQWQALTAHVQEWFYITRAQKFQRVAPALVEKSGKGDLVWTDEQLALLIDATWPDALLAEAWSINPNLKVTKLASEQWGAVCDVYAAAKAQGKGSDLSFQMECVLKALASA